MTADSSETSSRPGVTNRAETDATVQADARFETANLVILDGSMGQELIRTGAIDGTKMWATEALVSNPEAVVNLHRSYIETGVDVITTNSYSVTQDRFERFALTDRFGEMLNLAGELANRARDESDRDVAIAGCLPPLRGSYRPDLAQDYETELGLYREIVGHIEAHVDLFLCETMTTLNEARAAHDAAATTGKPVWVAWTLQNGGPDSLLGGQSWAEAVAAIDADAYLINCSEPEVIDRALPLLRQAAGSKRIGAYGNGFTSVPPDWSGLDGDPLPASRTDLDPATYTGFVQGWIDAGASIVGGCCEIGTHHMQHLCTTLRPT